MIFASGNYNFFNIMTVMLSLSLLSDQGGWAHGLNASSRQPDFTRHADLEGWVPAAFLRKHSDPTAVSLVKDVPRRVDQLALLLAFAGAFACMHVWFGVQPRYDGSFWLDSSPTFSRADYARFVTNSMQVGMAMGAAAILYAAAMTFRAAFTR